MNQGNGFGGWDVLFCLTGLIIWGPICAIVLSRKGRSGFGGYILGALLGLIGLLIAALLSPDHVELAKREAKRNLQINTALNRYPPQPPPIAVPSGTVDKLENELNKATKLLSDGKITEEEYQALKRRLIDSK
jgi:hypothetical protein